MRLPAPVRISVAETIVLAIVIAAGVVLRALVVRESAAQDDAFITYRYAQNLAQSHGFVYNAGERVLGTTTPLFTLFLAAAARLGISPEFASPWMIVVLDTLVGILGWMALRNHADRALSWVWLVLYCTFYLSLQACTYGMESQLFVVVVLASFLAFERGRAGATGVLAGLAFLVRPEAILLGPLFLLETRFGTRRMGTRALLTMAAGAVAVTLPWFLFSLAYFGSVVPHSIAAKQLSAGASAADWVAAFIARNPLVTAAWALFVAGAIVLLRSRHRAARLWLGWTVLYLLFMLVASPPFYAPWYVPPAIPGLLLGVAAAASFGAGLVLRAARARAIAISLAWVALTALVWGANMESVRGFKQVMQTVYIPMANWIRERSHPADTIFAGDIGYLGWVSGRRIVDGAGLVSPEVSRFYREHASDPRAAVRFVLAERPRFVVISTRSPDFAAWERPEFIAAYAMTTRFRRERTAGHGPDADYTVFVLRDGDAP